MEQSRPNGFVWKKISNWWHYHRAIVLTVVAIAAVWGLQAAMNREPEPDYRMLLIRAEGTDPASADRLAAAIAAFGTDCNGDGQVNVLIRPLQLVLDPEDPRAESNDYVQVSMLDGDLAGGFSGMFLLEDPEAFQAVTNALDFPDGTLLDPDRPATGPLAIPCSELPALRDPALEGMYLGGRWDTQPDNRYFTLLEALTGQAD